MAEEGLGAMRTSFEGIGPEEVDTVEAVDPAGPGVVRLVVDNAELAPPALNDDEIRHGGGPPPVGGELPRGFPVTCLGQSVSAKGELLCHYLDPRRRLRSIRDKDHGRLQILGLLGEQNTILEEYPQFQRKTKIGKRSSGGGREVEEWAITGWKPDEVARALIAECAKKGTFDPLERVRGLVAWLSPAGDLVLHVGDAVLVGRRCRRPGVIEGFVYSADKQLPRPAEIMTLGGSTGPAADLLQTLRTWNWKRPELDPYLLLGWTGAAKIGGALRWRPGVYLTGDTGTGKSTLIDEILRPIFGPEGAVIVSDATASGIAQRLKFATLPVIADELEATSNPQARDAIMELRRAAASGALRLRGSADQEAHGQQLRFCSLFSAILPVAISPQDENRSTSLELIGPPTGKPPHCEPVKMDAVARALTRQLVDYWDRLQQTIEDYRTALMAAGHTARGADQHGVLLACADVLLNDGHACADDIDYWVNQLDPSAGEQMTEGQHCLARLLQTPLHLADWPKVEPGWRAAEQLGLQVQLIEDFPAWRAPGIAPSLAMLSGPASCAAERPSAK